jgi:hypothetical protein
MAGGAEIGVPGETVVLCGVDGEPDGQDGLDGTDGIDGDGAQGDEPCVVDAKAGSDETYGAVVVDGIDEAGVAEGTGRPLGRSLVKSPQKSGRSSAAQGEVLGRRWQ